MDDALRKSLLGAHHRGQIVLAARAHRAHLPGAVTDCPWQWSRRAEEAAANG